MIISIVLLSQMLFAHDILSAGASVSETVNAADDDSSNGSVLPQDTAVEGGRTSLAMSLDEVTRLALQNSLDIQIAKFRLAELQIL